MRRPSLPALAVAAVALLALGAPIAGAAAKKKKGAAGADDGAKLEPLAVTCGSAVKLHHPSTGLRLHSHEVAYGSGSGQQSVTASRAQADAGSVWLVKPAPSAPCAPGAPLPSGAVVRLQHAATRRWLHSHHFPSPLSRQQEVSAFGGDEASDHLDEWVVDLDKGASSWTTDAPVRFKHVETGVWLAAHGRLYGPPISGQGEVFGAKDRKGAGDVTWAAGEGVYVVGKEAAA